MDLSRRTFLAATAATLTSPFVPQVNASTPMDPIKLQLWNDVSRSVVDDDLIIQKGGIYAGLTDPYIMDAILGKTELFACYGEFSAWPRTRIRWQALDSPRAIENFAAAVLETPRIYNITMNTNTKISGAHRQALIESSLIRPDARDVIDISGDGIESIQTSQTAVYHEMMMDAGMQCNGIIFPDRQIEILDPDRNQTPFEYLWDVYDYYNAKVISRDGFTEVAETIQQYPPVFRQKLEIELGLA